MTDGAATRAGSTGRDALLDAAAILYDEEGVDHVSLNRINQLSGHRNRSAAHYHFGSKDALTRALFDRRSVPTDARRTALLDELEARDAEPSTRDVIRAIVAPLSTHLATVEGRRHLRLMSQLVASPRYVTPTSDIMRISPSLVRSATLLARAVQHVPPEIQAERIGQIGLFVIRAYGDQARFLDAAEPPRTPLSTEAFTENLVDLLVAVVDAPASPVDT